MKQINGNIWDYYERGENITITTNGDINSKGHSVMGKGIALEMKRRYPGFPIILANHIERHGNRVGYFPSFRIFTFPTKTHWVLSSDINLIKQSAIDLKLSMDYLQLDRVFLPRPGCKNGHLYWFDVERVISPILDDDRFIVVS